MRLRIFSSIGGLRLLGNLLHPSQPGFDSRKDFLDIKVSDEDLSDLAVAFISKVGADASDELIEKCRELTAFADEHLADRGVDTTDEQLTNEQIIFIQAIEDNAGESKRDRETMAQYYERLHADYGARMSEDN